MLYIKSTCTFPLMSLTRYPKVQVHDFITCRNSHICFLGAEGLALGLHLFGSMIMI